jgi:hypothetical protein
MKNISVIEANKTKNYHAEINKAFLNIFSRLDIIDNIYLYCSILHYNIIKDNNTDKKIVYKKIYVIDPLKSDLFKSLVELFNTIFLFIKNRNRVIIYLSAFANMHVIIHLLSLIFNKTHVILICHGEMDGLQREKWGSIMSYPFWIKLSFFVPCSRKLNKIVLADYIMNTIINKFKPNCKIYSINHPYDFNLNHNMNIIPDNIFSFIGECTTNKGGDIFIEVADEILKNNNSVLFKIIGRLTVKCTYLDRRIIVCSNDGEFLTREIFNTEIITTRYCCFPYASNKYSLVASGAIFDAIKHLKPIIYIKNEYFDSIFKNYNIGFPCRNKYEYRNIIKKLSNDFDIELYRIQQQNLLKIQYRYSIPYVQRTLQSILSDIGFN